jgi:polyisoprenoid-binding protein YceI
MLQVNVRSHRNWVVLLTLFLAVFMAACGSTAPAAPAQSAAAEAPAVEAPAEEEVTEVEEVSAEEALAEEAAAATGTTIFVIDPSQSEVRFTLTELLMGKPTTVVGRGNGVKGEVRINFDDYSQTTISPIVIDASVLATDSNMRNNQIRRAILQTNQPEYQFITFTPTAVEGFPASAAVGDNLALIVTGDLTIRDITQPISFEVTVTPLSESELQGSARATLLRSDFGLEIPSVPSVADVSEEVLLEFDFVAVAQ